MTCFTVYATFICPLSNLHICTYAALVAFKCLYSYQSTATISQTISWNKYFEKNIFWDLGFVSYVRPAFQHNLHTYCLFVFPVLFDYLSLLMQETVTCHPGKLALFVGKLFSLIRISEKVISQFELESKRKCFRAAN